MTDAKLTLKSELEKLEREAVEKRDELLDQIRFALRKLTEAQGKRTVLDTLNKYPTLTQSGRTFVEGLPNTAKDDLAEMVIPTGPRH